MTATTPRSDANHCFVCGPENPIGLKIPFEFSNNQCLGEFTPSEHHVGFDGVTHGGIIFSVLDDLMANWLFLQGGRGYTGKCEIRYRDPLPVGTRVRLICEVKQIRRKMIQLQSRAIRCDNDTVVAEAEGSFMISELGRIQLPK